MKVVQINMVSYGSTGKIMLGIKHVLENNNAETMCVVGYTRQKQSKECYRIGGFFGKAFDKMFSSIFGVFGVYHYFSTKKLIKILKKYNPDVIHLHNLHAWYINIPLLFKYIKNNNIPVVWTLHDCWAFTGHCPYFDIVNCDKWKRGCKKCAQYKLYPKSFIDDSKLMWKLKKKWFKGINRLIVVTPSYWLAGLVKQSFLKDCPVKVIHNGIDLNVFKPTKSDFRKKYNILENKIVLLGVAFGWGERKGLDVFIELSRRLDDEKYQIVLVGTDDNVDKLLPQNIISIHRTSNQRELAEIYSAADLFVNPTREDNFPTVNIEALACGTPVITFKTGGSPECINSTSGKVVDYNDIDGLEKEIIRISTEKPFNAKSCRKKGEEYNEVNKYMDYIKIYEDLKK